MANKYRKALKILKSNTIDEKIKNLEESLPLNHTKGLYSLNAPGFRMGQKDPQKVYYPAADGTWPEGIPGTPGELEYIRPAGYWGGGSDWGTQITTDFSQDYLETDPTGRSTDTLIGADGTVFSALPPGGESFILGPIVDGFVPNHTSDAYTNIGYIQKDTRQFVLLGRISGQWKSDLNGSYNVWNGTSTGFTSYNQNFTLEMAQWVRDKILADAYVSKVPYFYSGGVPQVPQSPADCPNCPPGMYGGNGVAPRQFGEGGNPSIGTEQDPSQSGDEKDAGYPWGKDEDNDKSEEDIRKELEMLAAALQRAYDSQYAAATQQAAVFAIPIGIGAWNAAQVLAALIAAYGLSEARKMIIERGLEDSYRGAIEALKSSEMSDDEWEKNAERGRQRDATAANEASERQRKADEELKKAKESGNKERIKRAEEEQRNADKNMERVQKQNSENRRQRSNARRERGLQGQGGMRGDRGWGDSYELQGQILSESKKRIIRDIKKPVVVPEIPKQKYKMNFSGKYSAQNTPDKTTSKLSDDLVASGNARGQRWRAEDKYWQGYETTERMNIIFDRVGHGDQYWDEIVNENMRKNSWKTKEMQEHLNIMAHEKAMKEENPNYDSPFYKEFIEEQETVQADKDPLFKKVAKRLKKEIDYSDKPSKNGVPNEPPPEMVNGYHPDFGKRKNYYNKLDPQSAEAMPETGDDEIDAQVKAARKKPK